MRQRQIRSQGERSKKLPNRRIELLLLCKRAPKIDMRFNIVRRKFQCLLKIRNREVDFSLAELRSSAIAPRHAVKRIGLERCGKMFGSLLKLSFRHKRDSHAVVGVWIIRMTTQRLCEVVDCRGVISDRKSV